MTKQREKGLEVSSMINLSLEEFGGVEHLRHANGAQILPVRQLLSIAQRHPSILLYCLLV